MDFGLIKLETVFSVVVGGIITLVVSFIFYYMASKDLKSVTNTL